MTTNRYQVVRGTIGYAVCDVTRVARSGLIVDLFRSHQSADRAARLLNAGEATIDPHAVCGCKVIAR